MKYVDSAECYHVEFKRLSSNIVQLIGKFPSKESGFTLGRIGEPEAFTGDYTDYTTIYKELENGVQFSNDESTYTEPEPEVVFKATEGGELNGKTVQNVSDYSELSIPIPIQYPDYEFTGWSPEIPESGTVNGRVAFTAIFISTNPQTDIEARVSVLEKDVKAIDKALNGGTSKE